MTKVVETIRSHEVPRFRKKNLIILRRYLARRTKYSFKRRFAVQKPDGNEINGINALIFVSQLKCAVLYVSGNKEEAKQVQAEFVTTCPGVWQITTGVQYWKGDKEGAKKSWGRFCSFMDGCVNSIPIVGHVKGVYHKVKGEDDKASDAFLAATRTTAVMGGGIAGIAGGPASMFAGGIVAGTVVDGIVTKINSRPSGVFAAAKEIKENPTVSGIYDAVTGIIMDGLTGYAAGSSVKYARTKLTRTQLRRFLRKNAKARAKGLPIKVRPTQSSGFKMRGHAAAAANGGSKKRKKRDV